MIDPFSHDAVFYQNPFYDQVMGFRLDKPVPPKQRKGKAQNRQFETMVRDRLKADEHPDWPYTGNVMIVISITGPLDYLNNVDVDNVSKAILDACKGILIEDDCKVFSLIAEKHVEPTTTGFMVGVRKLQPGEFASFVPALYGEDPKALNIDPRVYYGSRYLHYLNQFDEDKAKELATQDLREYLKQSYL